MSGAILRRRDRTARSLRVVHYSSAVNNEATVKDPRKASSPTRAENGSEASSIS